MAEAVQLLQQDAAAHPLMTYALSADVAKDNKILIFWIAVIQNCDHERVSECWYRRYVCYNLFFRTVAVHNCCLHTWRVGAFMIYLHAKFCMPSTSGSSVVAINPTAH